MRVYIASIGLCLLFLGSSFSTSWAQCSPDIEPPAITNMPTNLVLNADADDCGATATWSIPTATDNCALMSFVGTAAPGDYFAVGTTLVTYTAMDSAGNLNAKSFSITVSDNQDPSFADPTVDITQSADAGTCSTEVFWSNPNPVDNCGIASTTSTYASGDSFDFGTTVVTYNTTDVNGRTASFSFNVIVTATDTDSDGTCDAEDPDDDNDGVLDGDDDDSTDPTVCEDSDNDGCDDCSIGVDGFGPLADNTPANDGADSDGDGICDTGDNCSNTAACNFSDPANGTCQTLDECGVCGGSGIPTGECDCNGNVLDALDVCGGDCAADVDEDGVCDTDEIPGCTDENACNYNAAATDDDGSCESLSCAGCTDSSACNFDASATIDDGSCESLSCAGCTDATACNFDASATIDDGSCESLSCAGCTDATACNFDASATIDDGSCATLDALNVCGGSCAADEDADGICDDVDNCSDTSACNYADTDDVACITPIGCETCSDETGTGTIVDNDQDNDNTCDDLDGCPNDPAKTAPGTCGCGAVDVDIDGDGVCDDGTDLCTEVSACNYADPSNAACINPTGCESCTNSDGTGGVDANDNDTDGTCNNVDGCPDDAAKTAPGICGCGNIDTDVDNDGVCDDNDLCTDPLANNYQSAGGEECAPCPDAPVFDGIDVESFATTMSSTDGDIVLNISSGNADTLFLLGQNGAANLTIELPSDLDNIPAGYYTAMVMDSDGCIGVSQLSSGGTTLQQPGITRPLIVPYALCCSGCGVNDTDSDGICDDDDNCTDQTATNYADPANEGCIIPGCTDPAYTEYNASATTDDGSCSTLISEGCTNPTADNYDAAANTDDGSCIIYGCMDPAYIEYNPAANTFNDGCSTLVVEGCMDPTYTEYNASANTDDGSCATLASTCDSPSMDGHSYGVVEIGDQCWFAENLRTTVYADDSAIPEETDNTVWSGLSTGARCDYDNDASNVATSGRLYNWYAATDAAGLCPTGWHVPTDDEWTALATYLGANGHSGTEGTALKSTSGWDSGNGTDDFGFSALPGGYRYDSDGLFGGAGNIGSSWSSSPSGGDAWSHDMFSYGPGIYRNDYGPRNGFSVRCLRDAD